MKPDDLSPADLARLVREGQIRLVSYVPGMDLKAVKALMLGALDRVV